MWCPLAHAEDLSCQEALYNLLLSTSIAENIFCEDRTFHSESQVIVTMSSDYYGWMVRLMVSAIT